MLTFTQKEVKKKNYKKQRETMLVGRFKYYSEIYTAEPAGHVTHLTTKPKFSSHARRHGVRSDRRSTPLKKKVSFSGGN